MIRGIRMYCMCVCLKSTSGEGGGHASLPILFGVSRAKKVENHWSRWTIWEARVLGRKNQTSLNPPTILEGHVGNLGFWVGIINKTCISISTLPSYIYSTIPFARQSYL